MGRTFKDQRKYSKKQRDDLPKFKEQVKKRHRIFDDPEEEFDTPTDYFEMYDDEMDDA